MKPFEPEPLPPGDINLLALMPLTGKANRAVAMLDGLLCGIPNPDILLSPMTTQEAVLSSKIEGTQADLQDVLKYEAGEVPEKSSLDGDIREIINYRKALHLSEGLLQERPFCLNSLLKMHSVLMHSVRGYNKRRGKFRTIQNWIGPPDSPIEEAAFIPPAPLGLQQHLAQWEAYWHADAPDPIIQLALIHAQFEIIHPFTDGNGRLGRMFIPLFLYEKKILNRPCLYLSAFFESRRDEYINSLRQIDQSGGWTRWCAFFLEGVAAQAEADTRKAREIQSLYEHLKERIIALTRSRYAVPLLEHLFRRPVFRSSDLAKQDDMPSHPTVSNLLNRLRQDKILVTIREGAGRRPHILALAELINLCEGKTVL